MLDPRLNRQKFAVAEKVTDGSPTDARRPKVRPSGDAEADPPAKHFDYGAEPLQRGSVLCRLRIQISL
jgi:hypothetical protein